MPTVVDTSGLDRLRARFERLVNPDPTPLMVTWMKIIDDDNRKGVLAGLDKNGNPLPPVTYRPVKPGGRKLTIEERLGQNPRKARGRYAAFGSSASGLYNNLSSTQYRQLDGPPLAPRRQFSRVITNLLTRFGRTSGNQWLVEGYWNEVLSRAGRRFLHYHFDGEGQKVRDLRGVRPEGIEKARKSFRAWLIDQVRSHAA